MLSVIYIRSWQWLYSHRRRHPATTGAGSSTTEQTPQPHRLCILIRDASLLVQFTPTLIAEYLPIEQTINVDLFN